MIQRHKDILNILSSGEHVTVNKLSQQLHYSSATIRKDLTVLEDQGLLWRTHGGAVVSESDVITHRMSINYDKKLSIAREAKNLVMPGETIFIESGSASALFAREVCQIDGITIITNNAFIARYAGHVARGDIILIGGIYQAGSECVVGNLARNYLKSVNFNKIFLGIDGFTPSTGFTIRDMMRSELNGALVQASAEVYILSDSTKFGKTALSQCCGVEDIDVIITDGGLNADYRQLFESEGVRLIIASE